MEFGSRKQHSALDAVHLLFQLALKARAQDMKSSVQFLDVAGAFDKVDHLTLAEALQEAEVD